MKKKIIIIAVLATIITSLIYITFKTDKVSILALGDSIAKGVTPYGGYSYSYNDYFSNYLEEQNLLKTYYREFTGGDLRTADLINMIENNEYQTINGKKLTVQRALVKSDYITICVGSYDLYNHLGITNGGEMVKNNQELNDYFLSMLKDLNDLIDLIQKYTTAKIIVIGFYNPVIDPNEELVNTFEYLDNAYKILVDKHNCYYISINQEISSNEEYISNSSNIHINHHGHEIIAQKIIQTIN